MTKEEMIEELHAYLTHIVFARDCLVAYLSILDGAKNYNEIINVSVGFFRIAQYSLNKCMFIEFSKLYCGSGKQEKTIRKLINIVEANINLFSNKKKAKECCDKVNQRFQEMNELISKLKTRRDKDLVHNDKEYFDGKINPAIENYISVEECEMLFNCVYEYCSNLFVLLGRTVEYDVDRANDLESLLFLAKE